MTLQLRTDKNPFQFHIIFIGMNPMKDGIPNRTKENVREIRHAYLDLDEDAGASLHALRTSGDAPSPNFVLDTSPGKHQVVWRVEGLDQEQAESLLRLLANQFGGDPAATDVSRVLRLPGFTNRKYNEQFVVRVHHETDQLYHLGDFRVQEDLPDAPRHLGDTQEATRRMAATCTLMSARLSGGAFMFSEIRSSQLRLVARAPSQRVASMPVRVLGPHEDPKSAPERSELRSTPLRA